MSYVEGRWPQNWHRSRRIIYQGETEIEDNLQAVTFFVTLHPDFFFFFETRVNFGRP